MKIVVPIKLVPDLVEELEINDEGTDLDRDFISFRINEFCDHAIEEALLLKDAHGGTVTVPRPGGKVKLKIPKGSQSGQVLRLRDLGVRDPKTHERGALFVRLLVRVPTNGSERVRAAVDTLEQAYADDPRGHLRL